MTVKDVLKTAAAYLDRRDIISRLDGGAAENSERTDEDIKLLLECYNVTAEEIAAEYFRLKATETLVSKNGFISCGDFKNDPITVLSVKNESGGKARAVVKPDGIYTAENKVTVEYEYIPPKRGVDDESDFSGTSIRERVLAFGAVTEFCLIKGAFEEAVNYHSRYVEGVKGSLSNRKPVRLKERKWL